jgi:hypothetical protein
MADEAGPGAGNIEIEIDGKAMPMVPTAAACLAISRIAGGLNAAVQRCLQLDFDTITAVITAGLNLNPTQAKKLPDAIFKAGLISLASPCVDFIHVVSNGGRPISYEEGDGEDREAADPPSGSV